LVSIMSSFDPTSSLVRELSDLLATLELRSKHLTINQRMMALALVIEDTNITQQIRLVFLTGLGFTETPDMSTPVLTAVREICQYAKAKIYKDEYIKTQLSLLKSLRQFGDLYIAMGFIAEIADLLATRDSRKSSTSL
jgi:hypothetical protein